MEYIQLLFENKFTDEEEEIFDRLLLFQDALISKNFDTLDEIIDDSYTLTHMSGKKQEKKEFFKELKENILNYYESKIELPIITINNDIAKIVVDITLNAKVYNISGQWTLNSIIELKKRNNEWYFTKWLTS